MAPVERAYVHEAMGHEPLPCTQILRDLIPNASASVALRTVTATSNEAFGMAWTMAQNTWRVHARTGAQKS